MAIYMYHIKPIIEMGWRQRTLQRRGDKTWPFQGQARLTWDITYTWSQWQLSNTRPAAITDIYINHAYLLVIVCGDGLGAGRDGESVWGLARDVCLWGPVVGML